MRAKVQNYIGLDSQCLSYLIDAMQGVSEPTDDLAEEKKALYRIYLYLPNTFYYTPTVLNECAAIKNKDRRKIHDSYLGASFEEITITDSNAVKRLTNQYAKYHSGIKDCRVLAEAEIGRLDVLLTYDGPFLKHLGNRSNNVSLITPSKMWADLNLPVGAEAHKLPKPSNPLSRQSWWRW